MDYRMQNKNGLEAMKEILEINNNTRFIFLSADTSIRDEALSLGAISFKAKPCDYKRLFDNIKKALQY